VLPPEELLTMGEPIQVVLYSIIGSNIELEEAGDA
jgi:hypothetical protein